MEMLKMDEEQSHNLPTEHSQTQLHLPMEGKVPGAPGSYVPPSVRSLDDSGDDGAGDSPRHSQADMTSSDNEDGGDTVLTMSSSGVGDDEEEASDDKDSEKAQVGTDDGQPGSPGASAPLSPAASNLPEMFHDFMAGPGKEMFKKMLQEQVQELQGSIRDDRDVPRRGSEASSLDSHHERPATRAYSRRASMIPEIEAPVDEPGVPPLTAPTIHGNVSSTETVVGPLTTGGWSTHKSELTTGSMTASPDKPLGSKPIRSGSETRKLSVHFQDDDGKVVPARPSGLSIELNAVDRAWGELFTKEALPTGRFRAVMRALAGHIIEYFLPVNSLVVTPQKLFHFYSQYSLEKEVFPLRDIFQPQTQENYTKLDNAFHHLQLQYHLIQDEPRKRKTPTVPALTPAGFADWMIILAQACPEEEARRLQLVFRDLPVELKEPSSAVDERAQSTGTWERLPRALSRHLLPAKSSDEQVKTLRTALWDMLPETTRRGEGKKGSRFPTLHGLFSHKDKESTVGGRRESHSYTSSSGGGGGGSTPRAMTISAPSAAQRYRPSTHPSIQHADDTSSPDPHDRMRRRHEGRTRSRRESSSTTSPSSPRTSFRTSAPEGDHLSSSGEGRAASVAAVVPRRNRSPVARGYRASLPEVHVSQGQALPISSSHSSAAIAYAPPGMAVGEELGPVSPMFEVRGGMERRKREGHRDGDRDREYESRVYASPRTSRASIDEGRGDQRETWAEYYKRT